MNILINILLFFLVLAELYAEAESFASKGKFDFLYMQRFVAGKYLQSIACRLFVNNINLR